MVQLDATASSFSDCAFQLRFFRTVFIVSVLIAKSLKKSEKRHSRAYFKSVAISNSQSVNEGKKLTRKAQALTVNVSAKPRINVLKINRLEKREQSKMTFAQNKPFIVARGKRCSKIQNSISALIPMYLQWLASKNGPLMKTEWWNNKRMKSHLRTLKRQMPWNRETGTHKIKTMNLNKRTKLKVIHAAMNDRMECNFKKTQSQVVRVGWAREKLKNGFIVISLF